MNEPTATKPVAKPRITSLYFDARAYNRWEVRVSYGNSFYAESRPGSFKGQKVFRSRKECEAALVGSAWEPVCHESALICCLRKGSPELARWNA